MSGVMGGAQPKMRAIKMLANTVYLQAEVLTMADAQFMMSAHLPRRLDPGAILLPPPARGW